MNIKYRNVISLKLLLDELQNLRDEQASGEYENINFSDVDNTDFGIDRIKRIIEKKESNEDVL